MMRHARTGMALVVAAVVISCAGSGQVLSKTSANMAGALKSFCEQHNIKSPETRSADSLYSLAVVRLQKGQKPDGYAAMDFAVIYYRLALSKMERAMAEKRLDDSRDLLATEQRQLADYKEVLRELKGGAR